MKPDTHARATATRRTFLKQGALLAAPLAAVPAVALAGGDAARHEDLAARVSRLESEAALRDRHQAWLRQVNAGAHPGPDPAVRRISADPAGRPDRIELAADGRSARGEFDCLVETETALAADSTLAQMAQVQGHGAVSHTQRRRLQVDYALQGGGWEIRRARFGDA